MGVLESSPMLIALCMLVIIDAIVVTAEVVLDDQSNKSTLHFTRPSYYCNNILYITSVGEYRILHYIIPVY